MQNVLIKFSTFDKDGDLLKEYILETADGVYWKPLQDKIYEIRKYNDDTVVRMVIDIAYPS